MKLERKDVGRCDDREQWNNGKSSFVVGLGHYWTSWNDERRTTATRRAHNSRRPIKSSTGLDLSTNEQQLLTFKVDERGWEERGRPWSSFDFNRAAAVYQISPESTNLWFPRTRGRGTVPGLRCLCHDVADNCWRKLLMDCTLPCDIGSTMGKLIIIRFMDVLTRLKVDIQGYLRVVCYLGGKEICSNALMNLIRWKADYYAIGGCIYKVKGWHSGVLKGSLLFGRERNL